MRYLVLHTVAPQVCLLRMYVCAMKRGCAGGRLSDSDQHDDHKYRARRTLRPNEWYHGEWNASQHPQLFLESSCVFPCLQSPRYISLFIIRLQLPVSKLQQILEGAERERALRRRRLLWTAVA